MVTVPLVTIAPFTTPVVGKKFGVATWPQFLLSRFVKLKMFSSSVME